MLSVPYMGPLRGMASLPTTCDVRHRREVFQSQRNVGSCLGDGCAPGRGWMSTRHRLILLALLLSIISLGTARAPETQRCLAVESIISYPDEIQVVIGRVWLWPIRQSGLGVQLRRQVPVRR